MKEIYRPHPHEPNYILGSFLQMRDRGMNDKQFTEANHLIVNISKRLSKSEIFSTIIILIYRYTSPERFIKFLLLLEKIIFRLFTVDGSERAIRNGSKLFGEECQKFFLAVKNKDPTNKKDVVDIEKDALIFQNTLCNWAKKEYPLTNFYDDLMLTKNKIPFVNENEIIKNALKTLNKKKLGFIIVNDNQGLNSGIFTDGDLKRALQKKKYSEKSKIKNIMTKKPYSVEENTLLTDILTKMNKKKITSICVFNKSNKKKTIGVIHIHQILKFLKY